MTIREFPPRTACVLPEVLRMMHQIPTRVVWSEATDRLGEKRETQEQKEKEERGGAPCCP